VVRILAAQGQQVVEGNSEFLLRITVEVLLDERRSETVKPGGHCRVGGKEIPRSRGGQRHFKRLRVLLHETAGTLQNGKGRMTFIQVTDVRLEAECGEQSPTSNPKQQLLLEAQLRSTAIQLTGNPAMSREVRRVIALQQVKFHPTDLDLPGA